MLRIWLLVLCRSYGVNNSTELMCAAVMSCPEVWFSQPWSLDRERKSRWFTHSWVLTGMSIWHIEKLWASSSTTTQWEKVSFSEQIESNTIYGIIQMFWTQFTNMTIKHNIWSLQSYTKHEIPSMDQAVYLLWKRRLPYNHHCLLSLWIYVDRKVDNAKWDIDINLLLVTTLERVNEDTCPISQ